MIFIVGIVSVLLPSGNKIFTYFHQVTEHQHQLMHLLILSLYCNYTFPQTFLLFYHILFLYDNNKCRRQNNYPEELNLIQSELNIPDK